MEKDTIIAVESNLEKEEENSWGAKIPYSSVPLGIKEFKPIFHDSFEESGTMVFRSSERVILVLKGDGSVIWNRPDGKEEKITEDGSLLAIALMDVIKQLIKGDYPGNPYDYSQLDKKLWKRYRKFLGYDKSLLRRCKDFIRLKKWK
jgi:hypothetical protein